METFNEHPESSVEEPSSKASFDYSFVETVGRIALYDDLRSAPRVTEIQPAETATYIEAVASNVYEQARNAGGAIPYSVIREVSENFIHARFQEIVVSILDHGNTIRFADHGPGIPDKDKVQMPGFTSAVEPMKQYIRGVGSGLPLVRDYLESFQGTITIEDNLGTGAVVTVSLAQNSLENGEGDEAFDEFEQDENSALFGGTAEYPDYTAGLNGAALQTAGAGMAPATQMAQPMAPVQIANPMAVPASQPMPAAAAGQAAQPLYPAQGYGYPVQPMPAGTMPAQVAQAPIAAGQPYTAAPAPGYAPYGTAGYGVPAYGYVQPAAMNAPVLNEREREYLKLFLSQRVLGVTDVKNLTGHAQSTVHNTLTKLQEAGLIDRVGQKRTLTPYGQQIAQAL